MSNISFAEWMFSRRVNEDMSQVDLAKATGLSRQAIIFLENGECDPSLENARKIAKVLSFSLDDVTAPPNPREMKRSKLAAKVWRLEQKIKNIQVQIETKQAKVTG